MPSTVAHDCVEYGLAVGKTALTSVKSKPGVIKWAVEKVEGPAVSVLKSKLGQTTLKVADSVVTYADGAVDKALNTGVYKSTSRAVRTTYSDKLVPATVAVKKTVSSTTSAVTTPIANAYTGALTYADKTVEYVLPVGDADDKKLPKSIVGISMKLKRRSVKKALATRKMVGASVAYYAEQAKPSNVKKNTVALYSKTLASADKLVDAYLPEKDGMVAKSPVMLVKKTFKRGKTYTVATVKRVATAVKTAPGAFKKSCMQVYKTVVDKAMKLKTMKMKIKILSVADMKAKVTPLIETVSAKVTPLIEAGSAKGALYISATDKMLLKYQYTSAVRNFAVSMYTAKLAPVLNPLIAKYVPTPKKAAAPAKAIEPVMAPKPVPVPVLPVPVATDAMAEMTEPAPEEPKKKKKSKKQVLPDPDAEMLAEEAPVETMTM